MEFKDKLKMRLNLGIAFIVIGVIMIGTGFVVDNVDPFVSSFGFALVLMGIIRVRNYKIITKDEKSIRKREIAETDERNISLSNKARSWAFILYIMVASIIVIVLQFTSMRETATMIGYSVCALVALYWGSYFVLRKKY